MKVIRWITVAASLFIACGSSLGQSTFANFHQSPQIRMAGLNFAPAVTYESGGDYAYSVALADINGDGKPDLLVTNSLAGIPDSHGRVGVLLGNGDGTFQNVVLYPSGGFWAYAIAVADINGDGKPDVLVANLCGDGSCVAGAIGILLGNGDGTFQNAVTYGSGGYDFECCGSNSLAVADINGDGKPDVVSAHGCLSNGGDCSHGVIGILLGNGDGTFQPALSYKSGGYIAQSVAIADVNHDGKPDLLVANVCASGNCSPANGTVCVLLANGDGTFQPAVEYVTGGIQANSVAVGDVNADGKPDLVVANGSACGDYTCNGTIGVLLGKGDGTFRSVMTYDSGGYGAISVALADVNGDGSLDLMVANNSTNQNTFEGLVDILLGNDDGTFQTAVGDNTGGFGAMQVSVGDVNADGKPDLFVANQCTLDHCNDIDGSVGVLINTSSPRTFAKLIDFDGTDGSNPYFMSLVQGLDGDLYGTTYYGGAGTCNDGLGDGCGTVFKITRAGTLVTLHTFQDSDGSYPSASLLLTNDGGFYGTTSHGGATGFGTIFRITPSGHLTMLHSFDGNDGARPNGALIQAGGNILYGTTSYGGTNNLGTIFRITSLGVLTRMHSFDGGDGAAPIAGLVEATDGRFYGTTANGGANGYGTVFRITRLGTLSTIYNFCGEPSCADGGVPFGTLVQDRDGNLLGTTAAFGSNGNWGTIFEITRAGRFTTLYDFCTQNSCFDGALPYAGLIQATDGNYYGTSTVEAYGFGTVYKLSPGGAFATLYRLCSQPECMDGGFPYGGLIQATNGIFYGTTFSGGAHNFGTVFTYDTGLAPFVSFVRAAGKIGQTGDILGQGFTGTTSVSLNGIQASFTVISDTCIRATVPVGGTTGYIIVTTPSGTLTSNVPFHVIP